MKKGALNWWVVAGIAALLVLAYFMYTMGTANIAQQNLICDSILKNC
jgi:hypothetical protein